MLKKGLFEPINKDQGFEMKTSFFNTRLSEKTHRDLSKLLKDYSIPVRLYQALEYVFRQAMSHDPVSLMPKLGKSSQLWFGGYLYAQIKPNKELIKSSSFEKWMGLINSEVDKFNKDCFSGELGFTGVELRKFSNIDKVFVDYYNMIGAVDSTEQTQFEGKIKKYQADQVIALKKSIQEMVKESLRYNGRSPGRMFLINDEGQIVITPKEYEYFTDYVSILSILWKPFIHGSKKQNLCDFISRKLRIEHEGNSVSTFDENLNDKSRLVLDEVFFDKNFNAGLIYDRLLKQSKSQRYKIKVEMISKYFLPTQYIEKLDKALFQTNFDLYITNFKKVS